MMARRWLFTRDALRSRAALTEDGHLVEYYEELCESRIRRGSIFVGIVRDVVPSIAAVFIEVTPSEKVFLQFSGPDALPRVGDRMLVQITRPARQAKAPQASLELKLPGHFLVLAGTSDHVGVSKQITDTARRERLRATLEDQRALLQQERGGRPFGAIARSLADEAADEVIEVELRTLLKLWDRIQERFAQEQQARSAVPVLLQEELSLPLRLLRDRVTARDQVLIDDKDLFDEATSFLVQMAMTFGPAAAEVVPHPEFFAEGGAPLFERRGVETQLLESRTRQVMLPGGGGVVIDVAEALCAIDVNSGGSTAAATLEKTAFTTNCEAAIAVAHQLRLRNIAGIIIIDFIEMRDPAHSEVLMNHFAEELARDPARIRLLPLDELGLAKLTRKKQ